MGYSESREKKRKRRKKKGIVNNFVRHGRKEKERIYS